jgi:hypothetical protein
VCFVLKECFFFDLQYGFDGEMVVEGGGDHADELFQGAFGA